MEWISVDTALPEIGERVLVFYYPLTPTMEGCIMAINQRIDVKDAPHFIVGKADTNGFTNCKQVTHWMPLPPPPTK